MSAERVVVSAKLLKGLVDAVKDDEVPISRVIEAGVNYYAGLSESEKKEFLLSHTPGVESNETIQGMRANSAGLPLSVIAFGLGTAITAGVAGWANKSSKGRRKKAEDNQTGVDMRSEGGK